MQKPRPSVRGFTLIELMIVVAVVAILASIAYPSYTESVRKGRRAQARAALVELMQQQERYMTQRNTYLAFTNVAGTTNPPAASNTFKVYSGDTATNPPYWIAAGACAPAADGTQPSTNTCINLVATPTQADPKLTSLSLSSTGIKDCVQPNGVTDKKICWP
ncbi:type IV pilin protein [Sphingomonas sp. NCPPB 2930]